MTATVKGRTEAYYKTLAEKNKEFEEKLKEETGASTFPMRMKLLRFERNLSRRELSEQLDMSFRSICTYETGERTPNIVKVKKIADFFDVSVDYLTGKTDNRKPVVNTKDTYDGYTAEQLTFIQKYRDLPLKEQMAIIALLK